MPDHQWILSVMHDHNITLSGDSLENPPVPEPIPDWPSAKQTWKWSWFLHIYGLGIIYLLLALYAAICMLEFRRRLRIQQYILAINWILLILGLSRALFLFIDAYESTGKLPMPLTRVLYGIAFPCLTSSYSLIQLVFMRITKVNMGSSKLQNYRVLAAIITTHFTIVIVIDITVAYRTNLKWLLMLCQSFFITWGLILCFGFVYGGFKMTQFTTETQRVLKQLANYQRVKHDTSKDGRKHELALHRISRPKLRILEDENQALSGASDSSAEDSSNSLEFYNEAPLIFDDSTLANAYVAQHCDRSKKLKCDRLKSGKKNSRYRNLYSAEADNDSDSQPYNSSESDLVTDATYTPSAIQAEMKLNECLAVASAQVSLADPPPSRENVDQTIELHTINGTSDDKSVCIDINHLNHKVLSEPLQDCPPSLPHINGSAFVNPTLDLKDDIHQRRMTGGDCVIMNGFIKDHTYTHENQIVRDRVIDDLVQESGYMADTELNSPKLKKRFWKHHTGGHKNYYQNDDLDDQDGEIGGTTSSSSPKHEPYPLRHIEGGTVSLYRIRQGRTLHKALKITYFTTLLGFICCILQLYAMFGVYGVLSNDDHVEPWPWFIYQVFLRLGELGMAGSMALTTSYFSHHRNRCKRAKRKKHDIEIQTQC